MRINQPDLRTIRVVTDSGMSFFLPYRFFWNGHDREPASVVLDISGSGLGVVADVKAFFLFGMVADRIKADAAGISISRSWNVMTPGSVKILFDVEFEALNDAVCLFPGVHVQRGLPASPVSFLAERTSYPASLILSLGDRGAAVFSRSAYSGEDPASIGISLTDRDEEAARLRVEVRFPGFEQPASRTGPRPENSVQPEDPVIECSGTLARTHELFLAFSPREEILVATPAAVLKRFAGPRLKPPAKAAQELAAQARLAQGILSSHLVEDGGVTGLRDLPGSQWLSSSAGLALAVSLRRLFPRDKGIGETALRLADFSLKGQLPSGLFYESYHLAEREWRGVRGQPARQLLSISHSARVADLLLLLAEDLAREGLPSEKYFLAGQRFVDLFVDDRGRCVVPQSLYSPGRKPVQPASNDDDIGGWTIFFPLGRVLDRLGRDRYKKALGVLAARFAGAPWDIFHPPASRKGRGSDSEASLLLVRMFLELRRRGYRPAEPPGSSASARSKSSESARLFASLLLPWIRIHGDDGERRGQPAGERRGDEQVRLNGTLVDSFVRQRLLFAGNETAYLLRGLAELAGPRELATLLTNLSRLCVESGSGVAQGTAYYQHTRWDQDAREDGKGKMGPVDSRRLTSEILFSLLSSGKRSTARRAPEKTPRPSAQSGRGARSRKPSGKP